MAEVIRQKPMSVKLQHHYRYFRKNQMDTYGNSGLWFQGHDQRQFTGGGAAYQCHALAAYNSAISHVHFLEILGANLRKG